MADPRLMAYAGQYGTPGELEKKQKQLAYMESLGINQAQYDTLMSLPEDQRAQRETSLLKIKNYVDEKARLSDLGLPTPPYPNGLTAPIITSESSPVFTAPVDQQIPAPVGNVQATQPVISVAPLQVQPLDKYQTQLPSIGQVRTPTTPLGNYQDVISQLGGAMATQGGRELGLGIGNTFNEVSRSAGFNTPQIAAQRAYDESLRNMKVDIAGSGLSRALGSRPSDAAIAAARSMGIASVYDTMNESKLSELAAGERKSGRFGTTYASNVGQRKTPTQEYRDALSAIENRATLKAIEETKARASGTETPEQKKERELAVGKQAGEFAIKIKEIEGRNAEALDKSKTLADRIKAQEDYDRDIEKAMIEDGWRGTKEELGMAASIAKALGEQRIEEAELGLASLKDSVFGGLGLDTDTIAGYETYFNTLTTAQKAEDLKTLGRVEKSKRADAVKKYLEVIRERELARQSK